MSQFVASEGSIETKAASDQTRSSTIVRSTDEEEEPSFECPPEDFVSFETHVRSYRKRRIILKRKGKLEEAFADGTYYAEAR